MSAVELVVDRVDVDLHGVVEELVDEHGVLGARLGGAGDVILEVVHVREAGDARADELDRGQRGAEGDEVR